MDRKVIERSVQMKKEIIRQVNGDKLTEEKDIMMRMILFITMIS
jgi:hypothetical protein